MPFTVVLPRLMAVLSWKEMKMVFGLVFLLIQVEMMETQ
jgi:glycopeptide antibiotics resistance protein